MAGVRSYSSKSTIEGDCCKRPPRVQARMYMYGRQEAVNSFSIEGNLHDNFPISVVKNDYTRTTPFSST